MSLFQALLIVLLVTLGVILATITVVGLVLVRDTPHSNELVRNWADGNGYRIIAAKSQALSPSFTFDVGKCSGLK